MRAKAGNEVISHLVRVGIEIVFSNEALEAVRAHTLRSDFATLNSRPQLEIYLAIRSGISSGLGDTGCATCRWV